MSVAKAMMSAARTAPKGCGVDNLEIAALGLSRLSRLARKMREIGERDSKAFFLRDADNVENSQAVVLIGTRRAVRGLNCGLCAGLVAKALRHRQTISCILAALTAPVVNTGVFAIGMLTVFKPVLQDYAGGTNIVYFLFVAFIGVNFLVEFAVNAALSAAIARIVQVVQKQLEK